MSWKVTTGGVPAAIAGVAPTLDYRFALDRRELDAVSLTDKLTVTRAATAAVNGPTGYLELAAPNVARFDHDRTTGESLGLLVEETRTNLFVDSVDFDGASWDVARSNFSTNAGAAPNGIGRASKLTDASLGGSYLFQSVTVLSGATYTQSIFFKSAESLVAGIQTFGGANILGSITKFDLSAGTVISLGAHDSAAINSYGNGWWRCSVQWTAIGSGSANIGFTLAEDIVGKGVYLWGAQLETGFTETSYIPTTTDSVTRTESAAIDGTGVITGTYTLVEKPTGCAVVNGTSIDLQPGYTAERVMVFPAALSSEQVTAIRNAM